MNLPIPQHVEQFGTWDRKRSVRWRGLLRSNRFILGSALLLSILLPELLHPYLRPATHPWDSALKLLEPAWLVSALALIGAHVILRKTGVLPLVDDKLLVLPTFLFCYGIALAVLTLTLRTFGIFHLVTSFVVGLAWYSFVGIVRARTSLPRLALAGAVPVDEDLLATRIRWIWLDRPSLPTNVMGLVFDKEAGRSPAWERVFSRAVLRNIPVYEMAHLREMVTGRVRLKSNPEEVFGKLMPSQPYLRVKRAIDTAVAIPALVLLSPLLALVCLIISMESPGSPIFKQPRIGYQGRRFTCYKLRTMRCDWQGPAFTQDGDPRITPFGRFLRKWRIDELPQLVNIIRGEMSWIGPRPEAVELSKEYSRRIPYYAYRHAVRPGISGWAAMHQGNVAMVDAASIKLEYDFYYLKYFSGWLDFLIVLMTIRTVVTGFGHK
jgi:lipopolysaccharide/colanic/teichoic acid biosynthesis glycosyltransferase